MKYKLFPNIKEMLVPETLSELEAQPIKSVRCLPFDTQLSRSGSRLLTVETNNNRGPRYVLKRSSPDWDWIMRTSEDHHCRSVTLWQSGLLDRLRPEIEHSVVACATDGDGWAILMHDVSDNLTPWDQPLSPADNELFLAAMATQHATFWEAPELTDPELGLCNLPAAIQCLSPIRCRDELKQPSGFLSRVYTAWELVPELFEPDVTDILRQLITKPQPLCDALARYPQTLLHGDVQLSNRGLVRGAQQQVIMLDWQLAAVGPATLDFVWHLGTKLGTHLPIAKEAAIECYRRHLAHLLGDRFDLTQWQPLLDLGFLAALVRYQCAMVLMVKYPQNRLMRICAPGELAWWSERVRAAVKWL